ncbi:MAG: glutathione S-transferase family protein [Alphaproteobacteria bacterium]
MIDLYYWPSVNGRKITIALEEMGLPYNIIPVDFTRGGTRTPEFLKINPNGKMPAMIDQAPKSGPPITLFESAVILAYLAEKSGKLMPSDLKGRYEVLKWLVFQAANVGPMMGQMAHFHDYAPEKIQYAINRYSRETERLYKVLDDRLGEVPYLAGDYSVADISCWPWIMPERQEQKLSDWPNLSRWHKEVGDRPNVQRGNTVRRDLQKPGVLNLTDEQRASLYGWQQKPR